MLKYWTAEIGLQSSYLTHIPNYSFRSNLSLQPENEVVRALESVIYVDNKIVFLKRIEAHLGLRIVDYFTKGYNGLSVEPRLNINYKIHDKQLLNLSYMRVSQNSHLLFTSGSLMSNEVWVPADKGNPTAFSDQLTLGMNGLFLNDMFQAEVNFYFKTMYNLTSYREGYTSLMGDANWRTKLVSNGTGISRGIEFMVRKGFGDWTGFVSYSFARSTRRFPLINNGNKYLFEYNK